MKNYISLLILPLVFLVSACDDKADPFRNQSENVQQAEIEPTEDPALPGISPNAIDITLLRDLDALYFEEGVEYAYEVNVRLYLPNVDFDAELVGAPDGMTLELKSTFNTEVVTSPVTPDPNAPVDPNAPPEDDSEVEETPASVANQKIYVIRWKPGFEAIPDATIPSITRFLSFKVNIGEDKQRTREFRYTVSQGTAKFQITNFTIDPDLREGEKRGKARVYVNYPGFQIGSRNPLVYFDNVGAAPPVACRNLPLAFVLDSTRYINAANDPNFESLEYTFTVDLTRFDITTNSLSCNLNVFVVNMGNQSDPYPTSVTVLNTITDPVTNWADNINLEFEQEKDTAFYFQVAGVQNEGVLDVNFVRPCSQVFNGQGDCRCRRNTALNDRHRMECLIEVNHGKTFNSRTYTIEFEAQMSNGNFTSRKVTFRRTIKFSPKGFSFFDVDGVQDGAAETEAAPVTAPSNEQFRSRGPQ